MIADLEIVKKSIKGILIFQDERQVVFMFENGYGISIINDTRPPYYEIAPLGFCNFEGHIHWEVTYEIEECDDVKTCYCMADLMKYVEIIKSA